MMFWCETSLFVTTHGGKLRGVRLVYKGAMINVVAPVWGLMRTSMYLFHVDENVFHM